MMEFSVNPELAPFLVSSTRSVLWVSQAGSSGNVRAAVRDRHSLEEELIVAVTEMGIRADWGNVHPLTTDGVKACVDHLDFYGVGLVEAFVAPDTDVSEVDFKGLTCTQAEWVPKDSVVVVPIDRGFVGTLGTVGPHKAVALIHNASRGIGIAYR
jgi:hypothetical protein